MGHDGAMCVASSHIEPEKLYRSRRNTLCEFAKIKRVRIRRANTTYNTTRTMASQEGRTYTHIYLSRVAAVSTING